MRTTLVLLAASAASLASCRSHGLGSVPESLVGLYDVAAPTGSMELELDRDGRVCEMESEIALSDLPVRVRQAALAQAPGALLVGAERELQADGWLWEVKLWHDGRDWEFVLDEDGQVHEIEQMLHYFEWPLHVLAAADAALTGGVVTSVEVVRHGDAFVYHVKKKRDGARYKLVVGNDGVVQRKVREQRAEIEIPLAD